MRTKSKRFATSCFCLLTNGYIHIFARCCFSTDRNRVNRLISCIKTNCNTIFFSCICAFTNRYCFITSTCRIRTNSNCIMGYNVSAFSILTIISISISTCTNINILYTLVCTSYIIWVRRIDRDGTCLGIYRCLSSTNHAHYSTRKCGQFNDLFRLGFTLSMPKFRNCSPRLCSMIPNNFKHFVHIKLFLLLG